MKNKIFTAMLIALVLTMSNVANAIYVRVSDGSIVINPAAESTTVWHIGEGTLSGQLLGAFNVSVHGELYNVEFKEGTFNDIFGDQNNLDVFSDEQAFDFSNALANRVFVNSGSYSYASAPDMISGCTYTFYCVLFTPFSASSSEVMARTAVNSEPGLVVDIFFAVTLSTMYDSSLDDRTTYVDWSSATVVPEPRSALFVLMCVTGMIVKFRKSRR